MRQKLALTAAMVLMLGGMLFPALAARAQEPGEQAMGPGAHRREFAGMQRVMGEITAVSGANVTVKTEDGTVYQVVTTPNTRVMKAGAALKVSELKVGDGVMSMGNLDAPNKTLDAAMLFATDAAQLRKMRENLGKTYIIGKVTAIDADNAKMTVERPDGAVQTIGFDETTSFRRGRVGRGGIGMGMRMGAEHGADGGAADSGESITLADIKVGDEVSGTGSVKGGVFVPTLLTVGTPRTGRREGRGHEGVPDATPGMAPGTAAPETPGPGMQ